MIVRETVDGLIRTYSDANVYIHGGSPEDDYEEAFDPIEREYTETDIPIEHEVTDEEYAEIGRVFMGVSE